MSRGIFVISLFASVISSCGENSTNNVLTRNTPYQENKFLSESKYKYGSEPLA